MLAKFLVSEKMVCFNKNKYLKSIIEETPVFNKKNSDIEWWA